MNDPNEDPGYERRPRVMSGIDAAMKRWAGWAGLFGDGLALASKLDEGAGGFVATAVSHRYAAVAVDLC